eukprot:g786.t1
MQHLYRLHMPLASPRQCREWRVSTSQPACFLTWGSETWPPPTSLGAATSEEVVKPFGSKCRVTPVMAAKRQRQAYVLKCTHSSDLFNEDRDLLSKSHCEDLEGEMDEDAEWADYGGRGWTFVTDEQDGLRDESSDGDDEEEEEEEKDGYRLDKLFGGAVHMEEEIEEGELEEHEQPAQEHKRRPPAAKFTTASELLSYKKYLTGLRDRQKDSEAEGILQALLSKKVRQADLEESGIRMELSSSHWQENGDLELSVTSSLAVSRFRPITRDCKAGARFAQAAVAAAHLDLDVLDFCVTQLSTSRAAAMPVLLPLRACSTTSPLALSGSDSSDESSSSDKNEYAEGLGFADRHRPAISSFEFDNHPREERRMHNRKEYFEQPRSSSGEVTRCIELPQPKGDGPILTTLRELEAKEEKEEREAKRARTASRGQPARGHPGAIPQLRAYGACLALLRTGSGSSTATAAEGSAVEIFRSLRALEVGEAELRGSGIGVFVSTGRVVGTVWESEG